MYLWSGRVCQLWGYHNPFARTVSTPAWWIYKVNTLNLCHPVGYPLGTWGFEFFCCGRSKMRCAVLYCKTNTGFQRLSLKQKT